MSGYTSKPGAGVAGETGAETVAPLRTLDGFGAFGPPPSTAKPLPGRLPGPGDAGSSARLLWPGRRPAGGKHAGGGRPHRGRSIPRRLRARRASYTNSEPRDLRGILLSSALALFLIDADRRRAAGRRHRGVAAAARGAGGPGAWRCILSARAGRRRRRRTPTTRMILPSRRPRRPGSPMSSPAMPTSIPSSRRACPD